MAKPKRSLPASENAKPVLVRLGEDTHRTLRVLAAEIGMSMTSACKLALELLAAGKPVTAKSIAAEWAVRQDD